MFIKVRNIFSANTGSLHIYIYIDYTLYVYIYTCLTIKDTSKFDY